MTDPFQNKDVVQRLARRMTTDEQTAAAWLSVLTAISP
jgi:hypothetical protein